MTDHRPDDKRFSPNGPMRERTYRSLDTEFAAFKAAMRGKETPASVTRKLVNAFTKRRQRKRSANPT